MSVCHTVRWAAALALCRVSLLVGVDLGSVVGRPVSLGTFLCKVGHEGQEKGIKARAQ